MAKGRKRGCPISIRNWLVYIYDVTSADWVRIYGLTSLTNTISGETEDGSTETDVWSEPYITKRSGSVALEGKRVVVDSTGEDDPGQVLLNWYAEQAGCDGDATLKFVDPYGHSWIADYVVTSHETSQDNTDDSESWDLELVGEVEVQPYTHVTTVALKDGDDTVTTLSMTAGGTAKTLSVAFTPATASNKRFRVNNSNRNIISITGVTEDGFVVTPLAAGTATITVTSINGTKTASCAVTVSAS